MMEFINSIIGNEHSRHHPIIIYGDEVLEDHYDRNMAKRVNSLAMTFDLDIIVSSTWRNHYSIDELSQILKSIGICKPIVGITTNEIFDVTYSDRLKDNPLEISFNRGAQIKKTLEDLNITEYVIIDDDPSAGMIDDSRFVKCNSFIGFDEEAYMKAVAICESL